MIVCVCNPVTDRQLREAIAEGADSFETLQFQLGVALCCGKCENMVREILADEANPGEGQAKSILNLPSAPIFFQPRKSA